MLNRMLDGRGECEMVELSLAVLGAEALSEGIKFLYAQAGEVLKRWWARKDEADATVPMPTQSASAELFAGQLQPLVVHLDAVAPLQGELEQLMQALTPYAQGRPVEPGDEQLLRATDGLRQALEAVFQQRITFRGEERPASGPVVSGEITAHNMAGQLAGVVADVIEGGAAVAPASYTLRSRMAVIRSAADIAKYCRLAVQGKISGNEWRTTTYVFNSWKLAKSTASIFNINDKATVAAERERAKSKVGPYLAKHGGYIAYVVAKYAIARLVGGPAGVGVVAFYDTLKAHHIVLSGSTPGKFEAVKKRIYPYGIPEVYYDYHLIYRYY